jgi:hypothetical protein
LRRPTFQFIGRISYSWYLWHWPVLILAPALVGHPLSLFENLVLAAGSGVLAAVTFVVVEQPVRASRWLAALPWRSLSLGTVMTIAAATACLVSVLLLPSLSGHGKAPLASAAIKSLPAASAGPSGAAPAQPPPDTLSSQIFDGTAAVQAQVARSVNDEDVPTNLDPSLPDAAADQPVVSFDGCQDGYSDTSLQPCVFGDTSSPTTVVLFGDSHAGMWFPAVEQAADAYGWRLIVWTKATCPPLTLPIFSPVLNRTFTECNEWQDNVLDQIAAIRPALVVLGMARHYTSIYNFTVYSPQWISAMGQMVHTIRSMGAQVLVLGPVPKPPYVVPQCLAIRLTTARICTVPVGVGLDASGIAAEQAAVVSAGGRYVNVAPWFCTATTCAVIVDNLLVYRDDNHITAAYSSFLAPVMGPELEQALEPPTPIPDRARGS